MKITVGGREFDVALGSDTVTVDGKQYAVEVRWDGTIPIVTVDGLPFRVELPEERAPEMTVMVDYRPTRIGATGTPTARPARRASKAGAAPAPAAVKGAVTASMTGEIVEVHVAPGDRVNEGAILVILEAMKMRNEVLAPAGGTVKAVEVAPGSRVNQGDVLVVLDDDAA